MPPRRGSEERQASGFWTLAKRPLLALTASTAPYPIGGLSDQPASSEMSGSVLGVALTSNSGSFGWLITGITSIDLRNG